MSRQQSIQNYYQLNYYGEVYKGTINELAEQLGKPKYILWSLIDGARTDVWGEVIGRAHPVYEFYKVNGDKYLGTSTQQDLAKKLGVKTTTIGNTHRYRKEFTGEYKIVEDDDMITRRTINKVAPVPVPEKYEPERKIKVVTTRPVEMREFKFKDKWINYQLSGMFRNWG